MMVGFALWVYETLVVRFCAWLSLSASVLALDSPPFHLSAAAAVGASVSGKRYTHETKSRHAVKCDG
jgi:hypothetical protein